MRLPENDFQILKLTGAFYDALDYVEEYVEHIKGIKQLHYREFERKYGFSPLKYFQKELGI